MKKAILFTVFGSFLLDAQNAIRRLPGFERRNIPANDDGSSALIPLPFTVNFFGRIRSAAYVNNNGNITFDSALSTFTPFGLENTGREIIAAFFGDVDTRGAGSRLVTFGEDTVDGRRAFGVNYIDVGYFASHVDRLNSFQLILIERSDTGSGNFDVEFNYEKIQWETGDASGGSGGLGGTPAAVGWSNGSGLPGTSFELAGSLISGAFLDNGPRALARRRLNSPILGRYTFRARNGQLSPGLQITTGTNLPRGVVGIPYIGNFTAEGGTNPYRWTLTPDPGAPLPGLSLNPQGVLNGTPTARGIFTFTVSVSSRIDNVDETVSQRVSVEIDAPSLIIETRSCPLADGLTGAPYSQSLRATGGPGPYIWSWNVDGQSPVPGLTLAPNGAITGTPTRAGTYRFQVRVAGPAGSEAEPAIRDCGINIRAVSTIPTVAGCPDESATIGVPYESQAMVSGGAAPWRWALSGSMPTGVGISDLGKLSGIPAATGEFVYRLIATDVSGRTAQLNCRLTVGSQALRIENECPLPSGKTGEGYSTRLRVNGAEGPVFWSLSGSLPPGVTLQPDGAINGSPNDAGAWRFLAIARDGRGASGAKSCSLTVDRTALSISACPLPDANVQQTYAAQLITIGGVAPLRWSAETRLPDGLSVVSTGMVAGTPTRPGTHTFTLRVADSNGNATTQDCRIEIQPKPMEIERPCPLTTAELGRFYREHALVEGGIAPYRWRALGTLPAGVTLGADGWFSGTPASAGEFPFTLAVEDARRVEIRKTCSMTARIPTLPDFRVVAPRGVNSDVPVDLQLSSPYPLPISGDLILTSEPNTGASDGEANQADPAVQLLPGGRQVRFTIPAGTRSLRYRLTSLGTVAARHRLRVEKLVVGGQPQVLVPPPAILELPRTAPTLSDACYTVAGNVLNVQITGSSSTRELTAMSVELNGKQLTDTPILPVAAEYFTGALTVRNGGSFRIDVPLIAEKPGFDVQVSSLKATVSNSAGTSATRDVRRCN
ncbi:MAG: hypothetical protein FJW30_02805 [Acidobacteria bacterium]|nr:hypothetical protein [Acidobacteriota bacterium]